LIVNATAPVRLFEPENNELALNVWCSEPTEIVRKRDENECLSKVFLKLCRESDPKLDRLFPLLQQDEFGQKVWGYDVVNPLPEVGIYTCKYLVNESEKRVPNFLLENFFTNVDDRYTSVTSM
jgi:hypothetical protein